MDNDGLGLRHPADSRPLRPPDSVINPEVVMAEIRVASLTDIGIVGPEKNRQPPNQDAVKIVLLKDSTETDNNSQMLCLLADGMGGGKKGEVAAHDALNVYAKAYEELRKTMSDTNAMQQAALKTNEAINTYRTEHGLDIMGTTLVAVLLRPNGDFKAISIGDSRVYISRSTGIQQITKDNTLVQQLVDEGSILPEAVSSHPDRSVITDFIGGYNNTSGKQLPIEDNYYEGQLHAGESLLICSDGIWNAVGDMQINEIIQHASTPTDAVTTLRDSALEAGEINIQVQDNISAVVVKMP